MTISLSVADDASANHIAFSIVTAQTMRLIVRKLKPVPRSAIHARVLITFEHTLAESSHVFAKEPHIGRTIEARTNHTTRIEEVRILGKSFVLVSPAHLLFPGQLLHVGQRIFICIIESRGIDFISWAARIVNHHCCKFSIEELL
jgi:hypothetical protein